LAMNRSNSVTEISMPLFVAVSKSVRSDISTVYQKRHSLAGEESCLKSYKSFRISGINGMGR
jgi:hypothetical protein